MIRHAAFSLHTGTDAFAWSRDHALLWIRAVMLARRWFPNVILSTDPRGHELLVSRLKLPFTDVILGEMPPPSLSWNYAAAKLFTYRLLAHDGTPFIHLDDDMALWNAPPDRLLAAPALAQQFLPVSAPLARFAAARGLHNPFMTVCAGILGGNDTAALLRYAERAIALATDPLLTPLLKAARRSANPYVPCCWLEEMLFSVHFPSAETFLPPVTTPTDADWIAAGISHSNGHLRRNPMRIERTRIMVELAWPEFAARS